MVIRFFEKSEFSKFSDNVRAIYPSASDSEIKLAFDIQQQRPIEERLLFDIDLKKLAVMYFYGRDESSGRRLFKVMLAIKYDDLVSEYSQNMVDRLFEHIHHDWSDDKNDFRVNIRLRDYGLSRDVIFPAWEVWSQAKKISADYLKGLNPARRFLLKHDGVSGSVKYLLEQAGDISLRLIQTGFAILGTTAVICGIVFAAFSLYQDWDKKRQKEEFEVERQSIGTSASITGMSLVSAFKSCQRIGIPDLKKCQEYKGMLVQELGAPIAAKIAIEEQVNYNQKCNRHYSTDYCHQLLKRAVQLSWSSKNA